MNKALKKSTSVKKFPTKAKSSAVSMLKAKKYIQSPRSVSYQDYLIESLKDPQEAVGYLNAALIGGDIRVFLLALQNVVQAQGGVAALSDKTHKSRTSVYKS